MNTILTAITPYKIIEHGPSPEFPAHITLDPANVCNHRCPKCYFRHTSDADLGVERDRKGYILAYEAIDRLFTDIAGKVRAVTLIGGGEPLMHPRIEDIIRRGLEHGFELGMVTNGGIRKEVRGLEWIRVSLDATTPDVYRYTHGVDTLDQTIENIRYYVAHNKFVGMSFLIYPENHHQTLDAARLAAGLGVGYIQFKPVLSDECGQEHLPYAAKVSEMLAKAKELTRDDFQIIDLWHRVSDLVTCTRNYTRCGIQDYVTQVGANGEVFICCIYKYNNAYSIGNITERSFVEIWKGERRKKLQGINVASCPRCFHDRQNELIEYMRSDKLHANFI